MYKYPIDAATIIGDAERYLLAHHRVALDKAQPYQLHDALAQATMLAIAPRWHKNEQALLENDRRVAYISAEWLMGRLWHNNLTSLGLYDEVERLLGERGARLSDLEDIEDAALGNGGLGRLAACYADAAATHSIPLTGYGLYYRFGLFRQSFSDGRQQEDPDDWTRHGDPWTIRREDEAVIVPFADFSVRAVPHDMPVIGARGVIRTLRLWQAESLEPIDMAAFNQQNYDKASRAVVRAADMTALLYPGDSKVDGKLLRLRQQYLLSSATIQDLMRRCYTPRAFADRYAIQLNDTHPVLAIPEFIRLCMAQGMTIAEAAYVAGEAFCYTNHTVMPEALECWNEKLLSQVAPALVPIIRAMDAHLRQISDGKLYIMRYKTIHMANLAFAFSHCVNGVANLHTDILRTRLFKSFHEFYPQRLVNVTNGVTPRRWLRVANPELTALLAEKLQSDAFLHHLDHLEIVEGLLDDDFITRFIAVKQLKKRQLALHIFKHEGIALPEHFLFDVQVKRLHEYKRQLLNALSLVDIYERLRTDAEFRKSFTPTAVIFGAKAAPEYRRAKAIIYFCNKLAQKINADAVVSPYLRVVFVQNYNCSYAEKIIPAANLSEQISPAGTEASGTGNMKLMINGALTLGTMDGANIEIVRAVGMKNAYIFGARAKELDEIRDTYDPVALYNADPALKRAVDSLIDGSIAPWCDDLQELHDALLKGASWHKPDHHFILHDFRAYQEARLRAYADYKREPRDFARRCLVNIARSGYFSADRSVKEYAEKIWKV